MKRLNKIKFVTCFILLLVICTISNAVYASLSASLKLKFPPIEIIPGQIEYSPTMYKGLLDVMINLNGKELMRESTDNYKNAGEYLKERGYVPEDISEEDLIKYVESHASQIKVHITNLNYFEVIDSTLPLPGTEGDGEDNSNTEPPEENIDTENYRPTEDIYSEKLISISQRIVGIIQIIGTALSVIIIIIIGIRYITGSVEEKAEYKTTAMLYIIGAILLFCTVTIVRLIYDISSNLFQ